MGFASGYNKISKLFVGAEEYKKAYLGDTLVFSFVKSRLPDGYTEVEYIQSSGTQYINTGVKPSASINVVIDFEPTSNGTSTDRIILSSFYTSGSTKYSFTAAWNSSGVGVLVGTYSTLAYNTVNSDKTARRMVLKMDRYNKTASVDGSALAISGSLVTAMPNMYLFSSTSSSTGRLPAKLYSCQIYSSGKLTKDFVPCTNQSGSAGLYDIVGDTFYANAGSGSFTAGPTV